MTRQIVQISDTHLSEDFPGRTKDLENCVNAINALADQPALVVHTGDVSHNGLAEEYHIAKTLLDKLAMPYFVMAGNRDKRAELLAAFMQNENETEQQTAEQFMAHSPAQKWVQYSVEHLPVRLLMIDTVCTTSNKGQLCEERLAHLKNMLEADISKPVALFLHHPPYPATGIPDPHQYEHWNDVGKLAALLSGFNNVQAMYCGHVHRFIDGNIAGIDASAITCAATDLRKGEMTDEQKSAIVFKTIPLG